MRLFISYRRSDSAGHVRELVRVLQDTSLRGEPCEVFVDVDDIAPGRNFVEAMTDAIKTCDVALAIIGRNWVVTDGQRRLDNDTDFVRLELRTAISTRTPIIGVLINDGRLPDSSELPNDIRAVAGVTTCRIRDDFFDDDVARLISTISKFERRSAGPPKRSVLRLVNQGGGWFGSDGRLNVRIDGKNIGELIIGKAASDFDVSPGKHVMKLQKGLRSSEEIPIIIRAGEVTPAWNRTNGWTIWLRSES